MAVSAIYAHDIIIVACSSLCSLQINIVSPDKQDTVKKKPKITVRLNIPASKNKTKVHKTPTSCCILVLKLKHAPHAAWFV